MRRIVTTGLVAAAVLGGTLTAITAGAATREAPATSVPAATSRLAPLLATRARTVTSRPAGVITFSIVAQDRISCASPTACLAVGLNFDRTGRPTTPAALSLHGTAWRTVAVKKLKGAADTMLTGVSCKAATYCLVVGTWDDASGASHPAAWTWNGTVLTPAPAPPMPAHSSLDNALSAVSCVAVRSCVAIGSAFAPGGVLQVVWTWNGKSWTRQVAVTLPGTSDGQLTAAHCFSLTSCVVGGITTPATGNTDAERLLFASWNGKTFTSQRAQAVGLRFGSVIGLSCSAPSHCAAVGDQVANVSADAPLSAFAEAWNGATWSATTWAGPKGAQSADLLGVSCVSAASCVAVGTTGSMKSPHVAALSFNGTRWSVLTMPRTSAGLYSGFDDVSCPKPAHCVAIGRYGKSTDAPTVEGKWLAGYLNGSAWKLKAA